MVQGYPLNRVGACLWRPLDRMCLQYSKVLRRAVAWGCQWQKNVWEVIHNGGASGCRPAPYSWAAQAVEGSRLAPITFLHQGKVADTCQNIPHHASSLLEYTLLPLGESCGVLSKQPSTMALLSRSLHTTWGVGAVWSSPSSWKLSDMWSSVSFILCCLGPPSIVGRDVVPHPAVSLLRRNCYVWSRTSFPYLPPAISVPQLVMVGGRGALDSLPRFTP